MLPQDNPLLDFSGLPQFERIKPEHVTPAIEQLLADGRATGEFHFDNELATASALLEATNGLLPYSLSTAELGERDEVERRASAIADLLLQGLLNRS